MKHALQAEQNTVVAGNLLLGWLRFGLFEMHPNLNISHVDTHCKHQQHCTECPFTGDDVYRRYIFNLLSAILNEMDLWNTNKIKRITPICDCVFLFHFVVVLSGVDGRCPPRNRTAGWFVFCFDLLLPVEDSCLIDVSDSLYSWFNIFIRCLLFSGTMFGLELSLNTFIFK